MLGYKTKKGRLWYASAAVAAAAVVGAADVAVDVGLWHGSREQWYRSVWKSCRVRQRRRMTTRKTQGKEGDEWGEWRQLRRKSAVYAAHLLDVAWIDVAVAVAAARPKRLEKRVIGTAWT